MLNTTSQTAQITEAKSLPMRMALGKPITAPNQIDIEKEIQAHLECHESLRLWLDSLLDNIDPKIKSKK